MNLEEFTIRVKDVLEYYPAEMATALIGALTGDNMGSLGPVLAIHGYLGVLDATGSFGRRMEATRFEMDPDDAKSILVTVVVGKGKYMSRRFIRQAGGLLGAKLEAG